MMTLVQERVDETVSEPAGGTGIEVRDLVVRFGGLTAVDGVSLSAATGRITGLIGPNGAGKTTTFNACSGLVRPTSGALLLAGEDITGLSPTARALRGLGRTFQRMELFDSLPVIENVAMGREAGFAGTNPLRQIAARRSERAEALERARAALELCGITALAGRRPADLSTGQRRLVELARVTAGDFRVLLLDEPSSGLDKTETGRFGDILLQLVEERGLGILLVEHDMSLALRICDFVYVLDFGKMIFHGTTTEIAQSKTVRAAYLGSEGVESDD
jgi:ABC-type branched-subunit amino acid transport system ATPase component